MRVLRSFTWLLIGIWVFVALFPAPVLAVSGGSASLAVSDVQGEKIGNQEKKSVPFRKRRPDVTVTHHEDANRIRWEKIDGAAWYVIYRAGRTGRYEELARVKGSRTRYDDHRSDSGRVYRYRVQAYRNAKTASRKSRAVRIRAPYRVYIAAGHGTRINGTWDPGCQYKGRSEAALVLPITKAMVRNLRGSGVYVYTDADIGNRMNIIRNIEEANSLRISAYVSVHCDYYLAPSGTMPLYRTGEDRALARALNRSVHKRLRLSDRGLTRRADLRELNQTRVPACIFETGSIRQDYRILEEDCDRYGAALAEGLCRYLGVRFNPNDEKLLRKNITALLRSRAAMLRSRSAR